MDESIRNAEKLIEAANSTLARMKINTAFDDFNFAIEPNKKDKKRDRKPILEIEPDDLGDLLGVNETVSDFDEFFTLGRKNSLPDKNINNINMKIESYRQELLDKEERELLRTLNFDRNELATSKSAEHLTPAAKTVSDTNISQKSVMKMKPIATVEDLKSKLLQTQEVVDRGIQTARELNESVDELRNKSLKVDRYDELSLIKSRSSERLGKSDSRSTVKTVDLKRCKRCNCEIGSKREIKQKVQKNEENVQVMKVIGTDAAPRKHRKLMLQQLPSLTIQGDLSCQKIPSVDIPPGKRENLPARTNTAFQTWSHEEILRSRIDNIGEEMNRSDNVVRLGIRGTKSVQCTNCGKVLTLRGNLTDAKQIDDLLKKCDYNVFDPRIEEFAEKCNVKVDEEAKCTQTEEEHKAVLLSEDKHDKTETTDKKANEDVPVFERKLKIKDLSSDLTRKYKEKAAELESDHLHFESILRDLFKKVEESRNLLKNCDYLNGVVSGEKQKKSSLNVTTPVLLSYTGSGEEIDDGNNAVLRPTRIHKSKLPAKVIRKKLEKRELDANCRLINSSHSVKDKEKVEDKMTTNSGTLPKANKFSAPIGTNRDLEESEKLKKELANQRKIYRERSKVLSTANQMSDLKPKQTLLVVSKDEDRTELEEPQKPEQKELTPKPASFPPQSPSPNNINLDVFEESVKHTTTITDYESDFEEDSIEEQAVSPEKVDNSYQFNTRLSTISEADSEVDPKISDLPEDNILEELRKETPETKEKLPLEGLKNKISASSGTSSDEGDTKKLLKKVNRDLREIASQELLSVRREKAVKNLQQEMTEPLKEVLDELKSQFQRTEILANKLTESIREVKSSETLSGRADLIMVSSLERRREVEKTWPKKQTKEGSGARAVSLRRTSEGEILSDSSSGTSLVRGRRAEEMQSTSQRLMTERPMSKSESYSSDKSYSIGEIPEQDLLCIERSSPSIGEVINENYSDESLSDENSVIKFL